MTAVAPGPGRGLGLSSPQLTAVCVVSALGLFATALAGLLVLGRPNRLTTSLQDLDARIGRVEARAQTTDRAFAYPKNAICEGSPESAAHGLQATLAALTVRTKLAAASSSTEPAAPDGRLQPLDMSLDGNGDYPSAIATLRGLADLRPLPLLDRVDLVSKGAYLHLHVTGRAYCRSPAHL